VNIELGAALLLLQFLNGTMHHTRDEVIIQGATAYLSCQRYELKRLHYRGSHRRRELVLDHQQQASLSLLLELGAHASQYRLLVKLLRAVLSCPFVGLHFRLEGACQFLKAVEHQRLTLLHGCD
jgi:hypothetical protein